MVFYGIIMVDFMVYYSENANFYLLKWFMSSSCLLFLIIVRTLITDIVQSFLKFSSLSFPLFLFLSALSLRDGFKDVASLILASTVVWERKSRACIIGALILVLFVTLVLIVDKLFSCFTIGGCKSSWKMQ